jgi:hypothetical protein
MTTESKVTKNTKNAPAKRTPKRRPIDVLIDKRAEIDQRIRTLEEQELTGHFAPILSKVSNFIFARDNFEKYGKPIVGDPVFISTLNKREIKSLNAFFERRGIKQDIASEKSEEGTVKGDED